MTRFLAPLLMLCAALPAPMAEARETIGYSGGNGDGTLGVAVEGFLITDDQTPLDGSTKVPAPARLHSMRVQMSTIATALSLTHYWALDGDCDVGITPKKTTTIEFGATTATDGWITEIFDHGTPHVPQFDYTAGELTVCLSLDGGTAVIDYAIVTWSRAR